jgi:hypothetical protein
MMILESGKHMKNPLVLFAIFCLVVFTDAALAVSPASSARWDRGSAMAAVRSANIDIAVSEIANIGLLADGEATVEKLKQLETRSDWPMPAREAALFEFTRSLAELPRAAVALEVMQHLQNYEPQTLVPHEDHGETLVPLFNIRGAAAGIENGWQRQEFALEALELLATNPATLVSAYAESANRNRRSGYLDSLKQADISDIAVVQSTALAQLEHTAELTPVVGLTVVITADTYAMQQLLLNGRGAGLSSTLKQLEERLDPVETQALLTYAILEAPAGNAALAMAAWWPGLRHEAALRDLLVETLADPALGSAAALALAQSPDIQTIKVLQDTAGGDSLAARRAQMALDINRERLVGEVQP